VTDAAKIAAKGDALDDNALRSLMDRVGATHVYVGPSAAGTAGKLSPGRLRDRPFLHQIYAADGVFIFRRTDVAPVRRTGPGHLSTSPLPAIAHRVSAGTGTAVRSTDWAVRPERVRIGAPTRCGWRAVRPGRRLRPVRGSDAASVVRVRAPTSPHPGRRS
jgi:hypothetical protein